MSGQPPFDLNLLRVFDAVMEARSVTRAAEKLGMSQSALSHALSRLRWRLNDQLFVRTPEGMTPTPRAERLAGAVARLLADLQRALASSDFDPGAAELDFRVAVNNYAALVLAGPIFAAARVQGPAIRLSIRPSGTLNVPERLDRGELDLALLGRTPNQERLSRRKLLEDTFVAVARRGHPSVQSELTLQAFADTPHLVITSSGDDIGFVAEELERAGRQRHVGAEAPFLSSGPILLQSGLLAVMARRVAEEFQRSFPVDLFPLPIASPPVSTYMVWHSRFDDDPPHMWLRRLVSASIS